MGKGLIWLGEKIVSFNHAVKCRWNKIMLMLMFRVNDCPNKICECKKVK